MWNAVSPKMGKKFSTSVTLDCDLLDEVKAEAARENRSVSQLIEIWIREVLAVQQSLREGNKERPKQ
jgi:hypothetical protein